MADKKTLELQIKLAADQAVKQIKGFTLDIKGVVKDAKNLTVNTKSISTSIKTLQAESSRAATSLKLFGGSVSDLKNSQAKMKTVILDLIDGGLKPESKEIQNLVKQYKNLDDSINTAADKQDGFLGAINKVKGEIGNLAIVAASVKLDKILVGAAGFALDASDNFRGMREDLGIMLRDMQAGAGLFNELQKFNFWTPFDMDQTAQGAKVLMAAKVPLEEMTEYLIRFGDISQGNGQKFQTFINAFSKASAKGKADMEVLNVYIDQGVQILDELGKQLGVTSADVVDMASKGKISFQDFNNAIKGLASEGGLYYESMKTASQRLKASQAGLQESVTALAASFGDMLAPAVSKVIGFATTVIDAINSSPLLKGLLAGAVIAVAVAINTQMIRALISLAVKTWAAFAAQMSLNSALSVTNPLLIAGIVAVGAATAGFVAYAASQQRASDASADTALALRNQASALDDLKRSAENYVSFMDGMELAQANRIVSSYADIVIPAAQKALEDAKSKLSGMTAFTDISVPGYGGYKARTVRQDNPEYKAAQEAVQKAQTELDKVTARLDAAKSKVVEISTKTKEAAAAFGTDWQDKNLTGLDKIIRERAKSIEELKQKVEKEGLPESFTDSAAYKAELSALMTYYQGEIDKYNKSLVLPDTWAQKNMDQAQKLAAEYEKSFDTLKEAAQKAFGPAWEMNENYQKEALELEKYYAKEREKLAKSEAEKARDELINRHTLRMQQIKKEAEYQRELARLQIEKGDISKWASFAANDIKANISDTQLGETAASVSSSLSSGGGIIGAAGGVIMQFIVAIIAAVMELENVQKILNFASTVIGAAFGVIGDMLNNGLKPITDLLEQLGKTVGEILAPLIQIGNVIASVTVAPALKLLEAALSGLGSAFAWLNNKVIVPVGNAIIDTINGLIGLINKIPGINIKKIEKLKLIGDAAEKMAAEMEKQAELVRKKFDRQKSAVEDQLRAQLDSLQNQYELGLISRSEYESKAEKYQSVADEKLIEINQIQAKALAQIEKNTYAAATGNTSGLDDARRSYAESLSEKWGEDTGILGEIAGTILGGIADIGVSAWNAVKDIGNDIWQGFKKLKWWDVGSTNIPRDHVAVIHQGEAIIPRTFADGIRSGELSLVGGSNGTGKGGGSSPVYVSITVTGSVVTENQLIDVVYKGIAKGIQSRSYSPLPQGA